MSSPAEKARSPAARSTTALHGVVGLHDVPHVSDLLAHLPVEGVEHLGAVQGDRRDPIVGRHLVAAFTSYSMVSYAASLTRPSTRDRASRGRRGGPLGVLGVQDALAERLGQQLRLVERQPEPLADRQTRAPHRQRCVAVDHGRELTEAVVQCVVLDHLGDQADSKARCALMRSCLPMIAMRMATFSGSGAGHPHHLASGREADADVRIEELRAVRRDGDVTGGDEVQARAATDPVDPDDDRLGHRPERRRGLLGRVPLPEVREVAAVVRHLAVVGAPFDVGAGAERTTVAGDHDGPHVVVGLRTRVRVGAAPFSIVRFTALSLSGRLNVIVAVRSSTVVQDRLVRHRTTYPPSTISFLAGDVARLRRWRGTGSPRRCRPSHPSAASARA